MYVNFSVFFFTLDCFFGLVSGTVVKIANKLRLVLISIFVFSQKILAKIFGSLNEFFQYVHFWGPNWIGWSWCAIFLIGHKPTLCTSLISVTLPPCYDLCCVLFSHSMIKALKLNKFACAYFLVLDIYNSLPISKKVSFGGKKVIRIGCELC